MAGEKKGVGGLSSLGVLGDVYSYLAKPFTPGSSSSRDPKKSKATRPSSSTQIGTPGSVNMDSERARRRAGINPTALSPGEMDAIRVLGAPRSFGADLGALEFAPNTERDWANQASLTAADFAAAIRDASNAAYDEHGGSFPGGSPSAPPALCGEGLVMNAEGECVPAGDGNGGGGDDAVDDFWDTFYNSRKGRLDSDLLGALEQLGVLEGRRRGRQDEDMATLTEMIDNRNRNATGARDDFSEALRAQGIDPSSFLQDPNMEILGLLADSGNAANRFSSRMFDLDDWASTDREMELRSDFVDADRALEDAVMFGRRGEEQAAEAAQAAAAARQLAFQQQLAQIVAKGEQDRLTDQATIQNQALADLMDQLAQQERNLAYSNAMGFENPDAFSLFGQDEWDNYLPYNTVPLVDEAKLLLQSGEAERKLAEMGLVDMIPQLQAANIDMDDLVNYLLTVGAKIDPMVALQGFLSKAAGG